MPPTHFEGGNVNMFQPYVVGQSGTESPEPVLVTRLPASTSSTVQPATNFAKRWSITGITWPGWAEGPIPPGTELVRRGSGLEREVGFLGVLGTERHHGGLRAALLVPRFDRVGPWRQ